MIGLFVRAVLALTLGGTILVLTPRSAIAAAPTCTDVHVGVAHNAGLPIFIPCSGGTGAGSPDILIVSGPGKGSLNPSVGSTSTDQWVTYTPNPGQSGSDSFTYRGVSPGSGPGGSDELGPVRTVQLLIAQGKPPVCLSDSETVGHNDGTGTPTPASVTLKCTSSGDVIASYSITQAPGHGSLDTTDLGSGVIRYTPVLGYSGPDTFSFRATSTCGAANCQSASAVVSLTVLEAQAGPEGPPGPPGPQGPPGPRGDNGSVFERLFIAASAARMSTAAGRHVRVPFVVTTASTVQLQVYRGGRPVAETSLSALAGRSTIRWNGRIGTRPAKPGHYALVLTATAGMQSSDDRSLLVLTRPR